MMNESALDLVDRSCSSPQSFNTTYLNNTTYHREEEVQLDRDSGILHLVGPEVYNDQTLLNAITSSTPYVYVCHEAPPDSDIAHFYKQLQEEERLSTDRNYYVTHDFGKIATLSKEIKLKFRGPPIIHYCIQHDIGLVSLRGHKLYNMSMRGLSLCFSHFGDKEFLSRLCRKAKYMGAHVMSKYPTNNDDIILIPMRAGLEKYETHLALGRQCRAIKPDWIKYCYSRRDDRALDAVRLFQEQPDLYVCPMFYRISVLLVGFDSDEEMSELACCCQQYGATVASVSDVGEKIITHVVVSSQKCTGDSIYDLIPIIGRAKVSGRIKRDGGLTAELVEDRWVWECLSAHTYICTKSYLVDPAMLVRKRKAEPGFPPNKRAAELMNGSIIANRSIDNIDLSSSPVPEKRDMIISEFIRTEENYVEHLRIIEQNYYTQIYRAVWDESVPAHNHISILDNYRIFNKIPPIRIAHEALVQKLRLYERLLEQQQVEEIRAAKAREPPRPPSTRDQLSFGRILLNWVGRELGSDGRLVEVCELGAQHRDQILEGFNYGRNEYRDYHMTKQQREAGAGTRKPSGEQGGERNTQIDVLKVYTSYLTAKEDISSMIDHFETTNYRFKALLKVEGAKRENHRLSLRDLMIEPVQRLPRMILLLDAILAKTDSAHPDYKMLKLVQDEFKARTTDLNEKKKIVDDKYTFLEFLKDISGIPMHQISVNRLQMSQRCNALSLCEIHSLQQDGYACLFLMVIDGAKENLAPAEDSVLEITRPKIKSGSVSGGSGLDRALKRTTYKHVLHIPLRSVTHVFSVLDNGDVMGLTYNVKMSEARKGEEKGKSLIDPKLEYTIAFRLLSEEPTADVEAVRSRWHGALVDAVNISKKCFSLRPIDEDGQICQSELEKLLRVHPRIPAPAAKQLSAGSGGSGASSKPNIFNFAKRSMSRAFSTKNKLHSLRKTQSQMFLGSGGGDHGGLMGPPSPSLNHPGSGGSVRFSKRTMRDSR